MSKRAKGFSGPSAPERNAIDGAALAAIVVGADDAVIGKTTAGIITSWNAGAERLYGYTAEEMIGRPIDDIIPAGHVGEERLILNRVLKGEMVAPYHTQRLRKDGSIVDVSLSVSPIREGRAIVGASAIARDVTSLRKTEAKFAALVEASPDGIIVVDSDGVIQLVNKQVENLFGYAREEVIGKTIEFLVPERSRGRHPNLREAYAKSPTMRPMGAGLGLTGRRRDGSEFPIDIALSPIKTDDGLLFSASVRDVTERKKAEAKFAALMEAAPDAIVVVDETGTIQIANHQTETLFGYGRGELVGNAVEMLLPERSRPGHPEKRTGFFAKPTVRPMGAGLQLWARRKDGTEFPVDISLSPLETEEGVLVSAAVRDISERLRVQEALRQAKDEADRANAAKSDFLSRMSHELRTPLAAILGFSELLQMHEVTPEQRAQFVERMHRAGLHLLSLINDVLDISRVESGSLGITLEPTDVGSVLRETLELIQPMAARQNVQLLSGSNDVTDVVTADAGRLKQVLLNLLSNAVKYNSEGGTVAISCERRDDRLRIIVADSGPGISDENIGKLFRPFERLGAERTGVEGTGMGLALSSRLTELMRGSIGVQSALGKGSTFWVEFPVAVATVVPATPKPEPSRDFVRDSKPSFTVVYAEDNLENFMLVEGVLTLRPQVRLLPAIQGGLSLQLARDQQPDLILLDLNLPDIPGEEVVRRLKADPSTARIPIVVVSADAMPGRAHHLLTLGAHAYITKPIDIKAFLAIVDDFLAQAGAH